MPRVRDFNPEVLRPHASPKLAVNWTKRWFFENRVWQFLILLPKWFVSATLREPICTDRDERLLEELLQRDFSGYTSGPRFMRGVGRRGTQPEMNLHRQVTVLAAREEQILVLRQELVIP